MKKKMLICLIAQFAAWVVFTFSDYCEENYGSGCNIELFYVMPVICIILYFVFRKKIYNHEHVRGKNIAVLSSVWLLTGVVFGLVITMLVLNFEVWIVPQATGGWENFLNGIEYPIFAVFLTGVPLICVDVVEVVKSAVLHFSEKWV